MGILLIFGTILFLYVGSVTCATLLFGWMGGVLATVFLLYVTVKLVLFLTNMVRPLLNRL